MYKLTNRLIIRPFESLDYLNWQQTYANLNSPRSIWDEGPWKDSELTKAKYRDFLKKQKKEALNDKNYVFGIFRKDDGVLVGRLHLMDISRGIFQNAYLGYRIFNLYWGQGYASEACQGVLEIAYKKLKLHRVEAAISADNKASLKVAKKIGLRKEGKSLKRLKVNKQWRDFLIFAQTEEDFKSLKKSK